MPAPFDATPMHAWLDTQRDALADRVERWARVNSGSANGAGLDAMLDLLEPELRRVAGRVERVALPDASRVDDAGVVQAESSADALRARVRPDAPRQALLVIHFDTVYGPDHPFQAVRRIGDDAFGPALHGPGVTDAKGGLAVMLAGLDAFERHATDAMKAALGWTVVLNPDEETGSFASRDLLEAEAKRAKFGMVYEPALPNGDLIGARKGSGNFAVVVRGKAAHAGREFFKGRNAIVAASDLATRLSGLTDEATGTTVNVARIAGGGANNVVPDLAVLRGNTRVADVDGQQRIEAALAEAVRELDRRDGFTAELHGGFNNPPKPLSNGAAGMLEALHAVGEDSAVGVRFDVQTSGGVCDGNKLAACGLPVIDTLGPVGRDIHSDRETLALDSLVPRAKLSAGLLAGVASGRFSLSAK
ncbi:MAG: hydrolase [Planctomycetota bacterium]